MKQPLGLSWSTFSWVSLGGAATLLLGLAAGCGMANGSACTELGCGSAFHVALERAAWPAGSYEVAVTADGAATICTVTLPFASCDGLVACAPANPGFFVETSGCALAPASHELTGVVWPTDGPSVVQIEIRENGTTLASGSHSPSYQTSYPNGEDCEPACTQATAPATLQLP